MTKTTISLLNRVFRLLLSNPTVLYGFYDISFQEAGYIEEKQKLPLDLLEVLAVDHFFEREHKRLGLSYKEAVRVAKALTEGDLEIRYKYLRPLFPFIEKKIQLGYKYGL